MPETGARQNMVEVARDLQISPFEVMRLLVVAGTPPAELSLSPEEVARTTQMGGIERWWDQDRPFSDDDLPARRLLRTALSYLLERGLIGGHTARVDNLWRGLSAEEAERVRQALTAWLGEGWALLSASPQGAQVSLSEDKVTEVRAFTTTGAATATISALWGR